MQLTSWYRVIQASLPTSRNFMLGVDIGTMPYALRTAFDLLGLTPIKDKLSIDQVVAALQNHEQTLEDQLGRTADDLIRDLNQFLSDQEHVRISRRASQDDLVIPLDWKKGHLGAYAWLTEGGARTLSAFFGKDLPAQGKRIRVRDRDGLLGFGPGHDFLINGGAQEGYWIEPFTDFLDRPNSSHFTRFTDEFVNQLPRTLDLTGHFNRIHEELGDDIHPDEMIPEDFYTASRKANLDDWVIKCKWYEALFGHECDLTPDQAQAVYYINSKQEIWPAMNVSLDHFCRLAKISARLSLVGSNQGYKLRSPYGWDESKGKIPLPRRINLAKFLPKNEEYLDQDIHPNEMIPEDFYTASRQASQDDWVIRCRWVPDVSEYGRKEKWKVSYLSRDQAEIVAGLSGFPEVLERPGLWTLDRINSALGSGRRDLLFRHDEWGQYMLVWKYKSNPPETIDLSELAPDLSVDTRPDEMIPEDFYR